MKRPAGSLRALIADDETLARQGIRMLLDRDGEIGLIEEAGNGKRAAELMLDGGFDLVFLDVQMPEIDGFAALRRAGAELPGAVIFVTARGRSVRGERRRLFVEAVYAAALPPSFATRKNPNSQWLRRNGCAGASGPGADREPARLLAASRCAARPAPDLWTQKMWIG
jgi:CheY-like chemotaxis protein